MFSYERSVAYPEGHRNVIFAQRGIRPLPRLPKMDAGSTGQAPDTQMLYRYLEAIQRDRGLPHQRHQHGHRLARQRRADGEPVVEIYQGDRQNYEMPDAPRSNSENGFDRRMAAQGLRRPGAREGLQAGFRSQFRPHLDAHELLQLLADGAHSRGVWRLQEAARLRRHRQHPGGRAQRRPSSWATHSRPLPRAGAAGQAGGNGARSPRSRSSRTTSTSTRPRRKAQNVDFTWRDNAPRPARQAITTSAANRRTARSFGYPRCGSPTPDDSCW